MKYILSILLVIIYFFTASAQDFSLGLGFELNQTRFRQKASTVKATFSNPHQPALGFRMNFFFSLKYFDKYTLDFSPSISMLRTKSIVTSSNQISNLNLPVELGYFITKKSQIKLGVQYSYLTKLISTFNRQSSNFTFFANHRHYISPTFAFSFELNKNWSIHARFIYFVQDLFNSGALDTDGNIVGPIMVTPYTFGLGFNYKFRVN